MKRCMGTLHKLMDNDVMVLATNVPSPFVLKVLDFINVQQVLCTFFAHFADG